MTTLSMYRSRDLADRITALMNCEASALADRLCDPNEWPVDVVSRFHMSVEQIHSGATLSAHLHTESNYGLPDERFATNGSAHALPVSPGPSRGGVDGPVQVCDQAKTQPHHRSEAK